MKKYTINRKTWRSGVGTEENGSGKGETELLNDLGYMCCLGQMCEQLGIPKTKLLNIMTPRIIHKKLGFDNEPEMHKLLSKAKLVDDYLGVNSVLALTAMQINDDHNITQKQREDQLIVLFSLDDIELEFIGEI